ncbi:MAG: RDD family protein [Gammaproteobacteria bacterium]|nr:RDD family protein [Gammaproteobacteria bacterium]MDH5617693.1 RDD family protein [Gammaproteobacteria bacterium]
MLLDTAYNIGTPEGVELRLPVAGLAPRSLAWLIDALIKFLSLTVLSIILELLGDLGTGIYLLLIFGLLWFYNVLFEIFNHGATPGKRALGIRVMNANGTPVGWSGSLLRNLIRVVDALPGCYAFGCIAVLLSRQFQRLGDLAAGTIVVYAPRQTVGSKPGDVPPVPLKAHLSLDEQQAIVSFGERANFLNAERAEELAAILDPMLDGVDRNALVGHANWLIGERKLP